MARRLRSWLRRREPRLEELLDAFADAYPEATFVEIGANDGVGWDPVRNSVLKHQWTGVLVEPLPHIFSRLRHNYRAVDGVRLENVAISDQEGTLTLHYIPETPGDSSLPSWYEAIASFDREVIMSHASDIPRLEERLSSTAVPCMTFDALCTKHSITSLDLLLIDTEGYDYEILRTVDLERYEPRAILFEHYHLDRDTYAQCVKQLAHAGYHCLAIGMDTVSMRPDRIADAPGLRRMWRRMQRGPQVLAFRAEIDS